MNKKEIKKNNEKEQEIQKTEVVLDQEEENPGIGIEIVVNSNGG